MHEIDPKELKALRIPTATRMQIKQFIKARVLSPALFDRAYFIAPKDYVHAKALSILICEKRFLAPVATMFRRPGQHS